eukprot:scaffold87456_cov61-Phaeocystis_antarctica.AAC.1
MLAGRLAPKRVTHPIGGASFLRRETVPTSARPRRTDHARPRKWKQELRKGELSIATLPFCTRRLPHLFYSRTSNCGGVGQRKTCRLRSLVIHLGWLADHMYVVETRRVLVTAASRSCALDSKLRL